MTYCRNSDIIRYFDSRILDPDRSHAISVAFGQSADVKKPLAKMTCEDFIGLENTVQPQVVYWAVGYRRGRAESASVNVEGIERIIPVIIDGCKKTPKESFWQKVKSEVKKLEKKL
jgi:acid stress chaperone HdeA